jgi:hypothetical protein
MQRFLRLLSPFSDPIEVSLSISSSQGIEIEDDGEVYVQPWESYRASVPLFPLRSSIVGNVRVKNNPGYGQLYHDGVVVSLIEYVHYMDPYVDNHLIKLELTLLPPGEIDE